MGMLLCGSVQRPSARRDGITKTKQSRKVELIMKKLIWAIAIAVLVLVAAVIVLSGVSIVRRT